MSRKPAACGPHLDPIQMAGRKLSCETIMFHQTVADRLGLNVTDHKCLDFLLLYGPSTAGELSLRTALTTGAITTVLDRLEKAGFVRREADPNDRRRVIVHPVYEHLGQIGPLFADLAARVQKLASHYTEAELTTIMDFMNRTCEILHEAAIHLREEGTRQQKPNVVSKIKMVTAKSPGLPGQSPRARTSPSVKRATKRKR